MIFNNNTPVVFIQIQNKSSPAVVPCGVYLGRGHRKPQGDWALYGSAIFLNNGTPGGWGYPARQDFKKNGEGL